METVRKVVKVVIRAWASRRGRRVVGGEGGRCGCGEWEG